MVVISSDNVGITEKSRVCVENRPKYLTLDCFKTHFSQIGELSDAMILRTRYFSTLYSLNSKCCFF